MPPGCSRAGWTWPRWRGCTRCVVRAARGASGVDVVLGDAAYSMVLHDDGAPRVLRNRRRDRDAGEPSRLSLEIQRTLRLGGLESKPRVRVVGPGAAMLLHELAGLGGEAEPGWAIDGGGLPIEASEVPWLGSLFA